MQFIGIFTPILANPDIFKQLYGLCGFFIVTFWGVVLKCDCLAFNCVCVILHSLLYFLAHLLIQFIQQVSLLTV